MIRKDIQQGRHTILQSHRIINPISADITESALDGSAREILFTLRNEAPIALNDIPVYYEVPVSAPDYVYISSSDCIISKSSYVKSPNSLVMSAVISEMSSGSTCSISLRATVNYDFDRLKDELDSISNDPIAREDPKISAMIDKAKSSLEQLDLPKANTEIMNAKAELDKRMSSAELERSRAAEAERLALEVNSTLSALGAIEDSSVAKIIAKARPYYESSLLEPSLEKRISLLRSAQKELAALDSHLFSEISGLSGRIGRLKERWLYLVGLGYADSIPDEIYLLEQSLSNASRTASLGSPHSYFALSGISSMKDSVQLSEDRAKIAESDSKKWESSLKTSFKSAVSLLKKSLDQLKAACGTSCPQELVSSAESALQLNPSTPQEHAAALSHINKTNSGIQDYVSTIRSSANTALSELRGRISRIGDQKQREILTGRLNELDSLYGKGKYLEVSQSAAALFSAMQPESATDNTLLILGGLALVIVAFVIIKIKEKNSTENAETRRSLRREGG